MKSGTGSAIVLGGGAPAGVRWLNGGARGSLTVRRITAQREKVPPLLRASSPAPQSDAGRCFPPPRVFIFIRLLLHWDRTADGLKGPLARCNRSRRSWILNDTDRCGVDEGRTAEEEDGLMVSAAVRMRQTEKCQHDAGEWRSVVPLILLYESCYKSSLINEPEPAALLMI